MTQMTQLRVICEIRRPMLWEVIRCEAGNERNKFPHFFFEAVVLGQSDAEAHFLSKDHQRRVFEQEQCAVIVTGLFFAPAGLLAVQKPFAVYINQLTGFLIALQILCC